MKNTRKRSQQISGSGEIKKIDREKRGIGVRKGENQSKTEQEKTDGVEENVE